MRFLYALSAAVCVAAMIGSAAQAQPPHITVGRYAGMVWNWPVDIDVTAVAGDGTLSGIVTSGPYSERFISTSGTGGQIITFGNGNQYAQVRACGASGSDLCARFTSRRYNAYIDVEFAPGLSPATTAGR